MKGFKDFLMRGNLIELAVAFIIGGAFATVVATFTQMLMDLIGKIFKTPNFSAFNPGGVSVGAFLTALVSFVILAAIVYFFVIQPYESLQHRIKKGEEEQPAASSEELLTEIRDLLANKPGQPSR